MARPAPGADRTMRILNFLADHPRESFTLSQFARELGLNKATCHATVGALADGGYLRRHPRHKTYSLGPALISLGRAAFAQFEAIDYAVEEMRALAAELDLECDAGAPLGDDLVIVAQAGRSRRPGFRLHVGQRIPLVPPLGAVLVAWAGHDAIEAWLSRLGPSASAVEIARHRRALEAVEKRGYSVSLGYDPRSRLGRIRAALARAGDGDRDRQALERIIEEMVHQETLLADLDTRRAYRVENIAAPVFGQDGEVVLEIGVRGFVDRVRGADLARVGEQLVQLCQRVTRSLHGRPPVTTADR